jgi:hypothetical protein
MSLFVMPSVEDIAAHLLNQDVVWVWGGSVAGLLSMWRLHGVDEALRAAWRAGVVLTGYSAGSLCWHLGGTTDSFGPDLRPVDGLGFLPWSNSVHYDSEQQRRPLFHELIASGQLPEGYATSVPRVILSGYMQTLRLPLNAIQRATKQQDNKRWPPTLTFESFEASVETVFGSVLRDPVLVDKGRIRQAKVVQLRKAAHLEVVAEQETVQADAHLQQRRERLAEERAEADRRAEQRKQEIERQDAIHENKVQEKAANKESVARRHKAIRDKAIDRRERAGTTARLAGESRALDLTKQALKADETVDVIDQTIEGTKTARKWS